MEQAVNLWPLIGIAAIVVGFVLRFNPVLVVIAAGIITGLAALMPLDVILEKLGEGFLNTRNLPLILEATAEARGLGGVDAGMRRQADGGGQRQDPDHPHRGLGVAGQIGQPPGDVRRREPGRVADGVDQGDA